MRKYTPIARKKSVCTLIGICGGRRSFHTMLGSTNTKYSRLHVMGSRTTGGWHWHTIHWLGSKSSQKFSTHRHKDYRWGPFYVWPEYGNGHLWGLMCVMGVLSLGISFVVDFLTFQCILYQAYLVVGQYVEKHHLPVWKYISFPYIVVDVIENIYKTR